MNVKVPISDSRDRKKAYGLALELQNDIIDAMTRTIENLRVKGKTYLFPFQKGIIKLHKIKLFKYILISIKF